MQTQAPAQVEPNSSTLSAPASLTNGGLARIAIKSGIRTSQLWLIVGVLLLLAATTFAGKLDANILALVGPGVAVIYLFVRENIYMDAAKHPNNALDSILGTILSTIPEPDMHAIPAIIAMLQGGVAAPVFNPPAAAPVNTESDAPAKPKPLQTRLQGNVEQVFDPRVNDWVTSTPEVKQQIIDSIQGGSSPSAAGASTASVSGQASLPLLCLLSLFVAILFAACGTPFGNDVANVLESPASQKIVSAAVSFGMSSLTASLGSKVSPDLQTAISTAGGAVANGVAWSTIYAGAELLRSKQSTASSGKPGALTATLMQAGLPQDKATTVAQSVATLTQKGVPPDIANEAVASALDGAAAAQAPASKSGKSIVPLEGKAIVPAQASRRHSAPPAAWTRTLYSERSEPVYPVVVTHQD